MSESKMSPVVHFEIPAEDSRRISEFYSKAFNWKTQNLGPEMGNYVLAFSTEIDEKGFPKRLGQINGGFYTKTDEMPPMHPSVVIAVDDIQEAIKKIADAGGKVLGKPMEIPGVGLYASFLDTEGNRLSVMQPFPM